MDGGLEGGVVLRGGGGEVDGDYFYGEGRVGLLEGCLERREFGGGARGEQEVVVCAGEGVGEV